MLGPADVVLPHRLDELLDVSPGESTAIIRRVVDVAGGRTDQHQFGETLRRLQRGQHADHGAHGMADEDHVTQVEPRADIEHVLRIVEHQLPDGRLERRQVQPEVLHQVPLSQAALNVVRRGLWKVVNEQGGTGGNARIPGLGISGKTGTVQVIAQHGWVKTEGLPFKYKDHAWFSSYGPFDKPEMVVVVFVEHGGHGGVDAAPLAKLLYEARFHREITNANLDLSNPETLEQIREGDMPIPGQQPKAPPETAPAQGLGH